MPSIPGELDSNRSHAHDIPTFARDLFQESASLVWRLIQNRPVKTSETISDGAECCAGLSVRFESSAARMYLVSSWPKNNLQLLFVKTVLSFIVVFYVEIRSF